MGLLDKAKQAAEQAASKAKEGVEDVQPKRELSQAYNELGKSDVRADRERGDLESASRRSGREDQGADGEARGCRRFDDE